jgi:hypothetical protein
MVSKIHPGKRKDGEVQYREGSNYHVNIPKFNGKCKSFRVGVAHLIPRNCQKCGGKFWVRQAHTIDKKKGESKPLTPEFNEDGLRVTSYLNQKICPDCKDREKEKPLPKTCEWCGKIFTPARSHAKTCSQACRKRLSLARRKEN